MYDKHTTCGILSSMSTHATRINDPFPTTDAWKHPSRQSPKTTTVSYSTPHSTRKLADLVTTYRHRPHENSAPTLALDGGGVVIVPSVTVGGNHVLALPGAVWTWLPPTVTDVTK